LVISMALSTGCGKSDEGKKKQSDPTLEEEVREAVHDVRDRARARAEEARARAREGAEEVRDQAREHAREIRERAGSLRDRAAALEDRAKSLTGEAAALRDRAKDLGRDAIDTIRPYAKTGAGGIENLIVAGKTNAVEAAKLAASVAPAIADGVGFLPIYIDLGGENEQQAMDRAIGNMPRVEVIDGLTVGFRAFTKRQFLVVWRQGARLIGFVYTSLLDVAIGHVVEQAPRLISLAGKVL
jgi:hypothetical protein